MLQQQEIKGTLAKLLATENLIVEHKVVETASFDVDKRVLVLPIWDTTERVYNLLVGHEVGHALFTPNEEWKTLECPKSYVNVTEDARIEKLMKRKFPGLAKDFFQGYKQLNAGDFFQIQNIDVEYMNLIDRINLHYKIGSYEMIPFNDAEAPLRDAVGAAETFEQALECARAIYEYEKGQKEKEKLESLSGTEDKSDLNIDGTTGDSVGEAPDGEDGETDGKSDSQPEETESDSDQSEGEAIKQGGTEAGDLEAQTDRSLADNLKKLASDYQGAQTHYVEIDNVDLSHHIVSPKKIHDLTAEFWGAEQYTDKEYAYYQELNWERCDSEYRIFKRKASQEVNYLSKEFEMKKSAAAYAREQVAKTGSLDMAKLHTYKWNDDIFKKITVRPDGKNHGLIFLLDWSGSMADVIHDTYKQLLSLCFFCRKSGIPFEVYAFVQDGHYISLNARDREEWVGRVNTFHVPWEFSLLNFLSSKLNNATFDLYAKELFRVTYMYESRYGHGYRMSYYHCEERRHEIPNAIPNHLNLGGTPLNEALACLQSLIPDFQRRNGVEKTHCVILTDGDAQHSGMWTESEWRGEDKIHRTGLRYNTSFRDRRNGRTYKFDNMRPQHSITKQLLQYLKGRYPSCNFLGFRIASNREVNKHVEYAEELNERQIKDAKKAWTKNKSCSAPIEGYQELFFLSSKHLNIDTEFEPKSDSKADIKRAFTKSLKGKSNNKKILSSFIDQIA